MIEIFKLGEIGVTHYVDDMIKTMRFFSMKDNSERYEMDKTEMLIQLANEIKEWWEENKYNSTMTLDGDEDNVFHDTPIFVKTAKSVLGDWEN